MKPILFWRGDTALISNNNTAIIANNDATNNTDKESQT